EMRDLLIRLAKLGKTLIVTSHILPELSRICDRIAILTHGKLRAIGTIDQISRMVSQQRTVEVQLTTVEQIPVAAGIIRQAIEPDAEVIEAPAEIAVRFRSGLPEDQLGDVLAKLIRAGIRITQFREVQTDLEEAFMSFARPAESHPSTPAAVAVGAAGGRSHG
ncbi:MAG: ABC transporter ATP-binding protein, partial [Planctomycetales bacterium]|nr:ABC transporter ATP-binding protein [Planctomycetales bacterium]